MKVKKRNGRLEDFNVDKINECANRAAKNLDNVISGLKAMPNFGGMAITLPHKLPIMDLCDQIGKQGQLVGAVNFAAFDDNRRLIGDNCDGTGFVNGMLAAGYSVANKRVLMIGSGGAARAIAFSLADSGVAELSITNRTIVKADELANSVYKAYPDILVNSVDPDPRGYDIVLNTTSLGLKREDPLPINPEALERHQLVAEIIMNPEDTPILLAAKSRGCKIHYGRPMFDHQVAIIASLFGYDFNI